jgi:hypothetical protein
MALPAGIWSSAGAEFKSIHCTMSLAKKMPQFEKTVALGTEQG